MTDGGRLIENKKIRGTNGRRRLRRSLPRSLTLGLLWDPSFFVPPLYSGSRCDEWNSAPCLVSPTLVPPSTGHPFENNFTCAIEGRTSYVEWRITLGFCAPVPPPPPPSPNAIPVVSLPNHVRRSSGEKMDLVVVLL